MIKSAEFMVRHGMDANRINLDTYSKAVLEGMKCGLREKQDNMPMIPTYLRCEKQVPKNKKVAVIDAGGTNFRTALAYFDNDGAHFEKLSQHNMPGALKPATWEEFISYTAESIMPLMDEADEIGFCFSYPAEVTPEKDSRIISLTKQVVITGAEGKYLGADLAAELKRRGAGDKKIVVLNDTPSALLGGSAKLKKGMYGGFIGMVAGTGINTCCIVHDKKVEKLGLKSNGKMLINLESGSFDGFPRGDFDLEMDENLPDTGAYKNEKMSSGRYLGELCRYTLRAAAREGVFSEDASEYILSLESLNTPDVDKWLKGRYPESFNGDDKVNLVYITTEIFERAARCMCCVLCGILMFTGEGLDKPVCIAVDGSLYTKNELFRSALHDCMAVYAEEILGRRYEFVTAKEMSLMGAAAAVLLN